ncbi:MAG: serine/threonine protein kinase [Deltaproteobacteria bacterium]|nr:serine/threonine protein kinase [Deltaproteobacteria bacterium]
MTEEGEKDTTEQAEKTAKGSQQFGKYQLIARLATGGMAEIYLASQKSLAGFEKLIVVKRILPSLVREERFVRMFFDEARIAAMLSHPNVVHVFDLGRIDGQLFIAMEYLSGESMSTIIKSCRNKKKSIPPQLAAGMIMQAAEGLQHAHTLIGPDGKPMNIVHRDISPQNLFVLYDGGVKVVDFGIAKSSQRITKTRTGMLKGKYAYMSPEQILTSDLDGRSDVFALGVVLWELLCGHKLYNQDSDLNLLKAITEQDAPSPASVNPLVPAELVRITAKALQRKKEDRYESAAALRADLASYLKSVKEAGDTVAIGEFMQKLFVERIKTKRKLVEGAKDDSKDLDEYLFGDISQYLSDTEHSFPRTSPIGLATGEQPAISNPAPRRSALTWLLVLLPLIAMGVGTGFFWDKLFPRNIVDSKADAGAVLVATGPLDAGVDAGLAKTDGGQPDGGDQTRVASLNPNGKKKKKKKKRKRRTKQRRKLRRKRVVKPKDVKPKDVKPKDVKPKDVKVVKVGPPGKLRLMTSPWTEIYYKGKKLGQTPLFDVKLPSGQIKLKAINKEAGIDRILTIQIPPGKTVSKRFNLY